MWRKLQLPGTDSHRSPFNIIIVLFVNNVIDSNDRLEARTAKRKYGKLFMPGWICIIVVSLILLIAIQWSILIDTIYWVIHYITLHYMNKQRITESKQLTFTLSESISFYLLPINFSFHSINWFPYGKVCFTINLLIFIAIRY